MTLDTSYAKGIVKIMAYSREWRIRCDMHYRASERNQLLMITMIKEYTVDSECVNRIVQRLLSASVVPPACRGRVPGLRGYCCWEPLPCYRSRSRPGLSRRLGWSRELALVGRLRRSVWVCSRLPLLRLLRRGRRVVGLVRLLGQRQCWWLRMWWLLARLVGLLLGGLYPRPGLLSRGLLWPGLIAGPLCLAVLLDH